MKLINYKLSAQRNLLAYYRQNSGIRALCNVLSSRFDKIQDVIEFILKNHKIENARGKWLDNIGCEVGMRRAEDVNYGNYFLVNRPHINVYKLFYFLTSEQNPGNFLSLEDSEFIKSIYSCILTNISSGTIEDILTAVKSLTEADSLTVTKVSPSIVDVSLTGQNRTITENLREHCVQSLARGIYLKEIITND
ncbi:DUF2612 domain-containing protein [bacterium]|nr:DUF2612 domain-containing protein [bacterium]